MSKRSVIVNIVGPENVGKNAVGSTLALLLQRNNESAEFVSCAHPHLHEQNNIQYTHCLGLKMTKKYDIVIMNGGLSHCLLKDEINTSNLMNNSNIDGVYYITIVLRRESGQYHSLEGDMFIHKIRNVLTKYGYFFIQCEYSSESINKLLNIILLHCCF